MSESGPPNISNISEFLNDNDSNDYESLSSYALDDDFFDPNGSPNIKVYWFSQRK